MGSTTNTKTIIGSLRRSIRSFAMKESRLLDSVETGEYIHKSKSRSR